MAEVTLDRRKTSGRLGRLMETLPSDVRASFTDVQREALGEVMSSHTWRRQSVDIRLSLPFLARHCFLTVVAGRERRPRLRRKAERVFHPLGTVGNTIFMGALTALICSMVLIIALVYSPILAP